MNGHLTIHSAPSALRQHIEWGLNSLLGSPQSYSWRDQPLAPGTSRTSLEFRAAIGTAAKIATALKNWHYLRFEVHELDKNGGELFRCTLNWEFIAPALIRPEIFRLVRAKLQRRSLILMT